MYVYSFVNDRATNSSDAKEDILEPLQERITGRYLAEDIKDPATGEIIVAANHLVTPKRAAAIIKTGVTQVKIRTILTCRSHIGVCAKCYGSNLQQVRQFRLVKQLVLSLPSLSVSLVHSLL